MRRPRAARPHAAPGWAHPYTGPAAAAVFYNDGGDPPTTPPASAADEPPKPAPPTAGTVVMTQEELSALAAREKSQGKRSALKEWAAEHGFSNPDDAAAFIKAAREAQQAQLSEAEKREQALAEKERELAAREAQAAARLREATRKAALVALGATGDDLEDATALLRVDDDADEETVRAAAEKLRERRPELFGATRTPEQRTTLPPAPSGAPAGAPPARPPATKDDIKARALERARQMGYAPKTDAA